MVPDEGVRCLVKALAQHVIEAILKISPVIAQLNAPFWSTHWSTHVRIALLRYLST